MYLVIVYPLFPKFASDEAPIFCPYRYHPISITQGSRAALLAAGSGRVKMIFSPTIWRKGADSNSSALIGAAAAYNCFDMNSK
jgi:hypothetical protein